MKKAASLILTLAMVFALTGSAFAWMMPLPYGSLEFSDGISLGTMKVDGVDLPVYGIRSNREVRKYGISENTVITVYFMTVNADGTGTRGDVHFLWDKYTFEHFGPDASYYYYMDDTDADGYTVLFEAKELGAPDNEIYRCVLRHIGANSSLIAYPRSQTISLDGFPVRLSFYALKDANGYETNYVRLRDLAATLHSTAARFNVGWDGAVNIQSGADYVYDGTEMQAPFSGDHAYTFNTAPIRVNGKDADLQGIVLTDDSGGGYTYFKLRDIGEALNFNVSWAPGGIYIQSDKPYTG